MAQDIRNKGYTIQAQALSVPLCVALHQEAVTAPDSLFKTAGVGRDQEFQQASTIRNDQIRWIEGDTPAQKAWLQWSHELQTYLNQQLILGLFSFESHFAHYKPGAFYKTHVDAFQGQSNRILSVVAYLNPAWKEQDAGELVLYSPDEPLRVLHKVPPTMGTVVAFLSEEFPHEVLETQVDRYSIAGWYRLNTSIQGQIDPPQ